MSIILPKPPLGEERQEWADWFEKVYLKLQEHNTREGINLLGSKTSVDMKTAASTTLFTSQRQVTTYISHVLVRSPSASLAGGTDYDFTNWKQAVDLSSLTATTDNIFLDSDNTKFTELSPETAFQITVNTGSTGAATADIDVFGYTG